MRGFDATATAVTLVDNLTLMKRVRQPFPNQTTLTTDQVALSEFVYTGDTLPAGVTNNSALAYPLPIATWLTPDLERARGNTFTAQLAVAHGYARGGRPVAAVTFIASDGTNTVQQTVSTLSSRQWASGLWSDYFECTINLSTLNPATVCTLDAIIYPWVGVPFQASVQGSTYPSVSFTALRFLNDRTGSYGEAFAFVNPAATGGAVSAVAATAAASPFPNIAAAATAIRVFNNATYGRNTPSGGTIRLVAGVHTHVNFEAVVVSGGGDMPLVIEGLDPANRAATIWQDAGVSSTSGRFPHKLKIKDLTIRKVGGNINFIDNGAALATMERMLVLENVGMDLNGTSSHNAYIWRTGRFWAINSVLVSQAFSSAANVNKHGNAIGCSGAVSGTGNYNMVACVSAAAPNSRPAVGDLPAAAGQLVQNCFLSLNDGSNSMIAINNAPVGPRGFAVVGTVAEQFGGATAPGVTIGADGSLLTVENMVLIGNTVVGSRSNLLYQDVGTASVSKRMILRSAVNLMFNTKTDVFGANANLTGNWPVAFRVGHRDSAALTGSSADDFYATGSWLGEVQPLNSVTGTNAAPLAPAWADDRSFGSATPTGGGDYTPGAASALPFIPAGLAHCSIDQRGRAVPNNGTARAGAIQRP